MAIEERSIVGDIVIGKSAKRIDDRGHYDGQIGQLLACGARVGRKLRLGRRLAKLPFLDLSLV